ncbi:hypothetical protein [Xanthomonas graminis]|uniref:hypothetical protein n=1 Tax=Xanthomonas graminis TaxID=3390026 RepID=UPI002014FA2A|nr:hypothetical protein [Xanthomonas translucens]
MNDVDCGGITPTFRVHEIVWETDGEPVLLPSEVEIACADVENIADLLSETYGWLVVDFKVDRSAKTTGPRP